MARTNTDAYSLNGVDISETAPTDGQSLIYDQATMTWKPGIPEEISDGTYTLTPADIMQTPTYTSQEVESKGGVLQNMSLLTQDTYFPVTTASIFTAMEGGRYIGMSSNSISTPGAMFTKYLGKQCLRVGSVGGMNSSGRNVTVQHIGRAGGRLSPLNAGNQPELIEIDATKKYIFILEYALTAFTDATGNGEGFIFYITEYDSSYNLIGTNSLFENKAVSQSFIKNKIEYTPTAGTKYILLRAGLRECSNSNVYITQESFVPHMVTKATAPTLIAPQDGVIGFDAVSSYDHFDQLQTLNGADSLPAGGYPGVVEKHAQEIKFTKEKIVGVYIRKSSNVGTFTGDLTFSIQGDSSGNPDGASIASLTISNADWLAISINVDYFLNLRCIINPANTYWLVTESSTIDLSNRARIYGDTTSTYPGARKGWNGTTWNTLTGDMYFKSVYQKNSTGGELSLNGRTLTLEASSSDGMIDGTEIDLQNGKLYIAPTVADIEKYAYSNDGTDLVLKIDAVGLNMSNLQVTSGKTITYSTDNSTYTNAPTDGVDFLYIKIASYSGLATLIIQADLDVSSLQLPQVIKTGSADTRVMPIVGTGITSVTYKTDDTFPYLLLSTGETISLEGQNFDPRECSTLELRLYDSAGTLLGSDTTLTNGDSIAITSSDFVVARFDFIQTYNAFYTSSNDPFADGANDGSMLGNWTIMNKTQGLYYDVLELKTNH